MPIIFSEVLLTLKWKDTVKYSINAQWCNLKKIDFISTGELDREKLGKVIFSDMEKRRAINKITHPEIYSEIRWQILRYLLKGIPVI